MKSAHFNLFCEVSKVLVKLVGVGVGALKGDGDIEKEKVQRCHGTVSGANTKRMKGLFDLL